MWDFFAARKALGGFLITRTGLLQPFQLANGLLSTAGAAVLYTVDIDSSVGCYIGPQILLGFGVGLGNQIPMTFFFGNAVCDFVSGGEGLDGITI